MKKLKIRNNGKATSSKAYLVLVRHGESVWNEKGLWTGWQDVPLSEKGKEEAKLAAVALVDIRFDIAYSSDLERAHETLRIMKEEWGHINLPTIRHKAYKERHYGIYTGKNKWKIKQEKGEVEFQKIRRGWDESIPEGESLKNVHDRVVPHFRENVLSAVSKGQNVLIVAHGNTHRAIIKHMEDLSADEIAQIEMETGEAIVYEMNSEGNILKKERRKIKK